MEEPETDQTSSPLPSPKFIPMEMLIDIITRLPSRSLVRFGAVSKFWYSFIRNPNFITSHLNRSLRPSSDPFLLLMPAKFRLGGDSIFSILYETTLIEHSNFEIPWNSNHIRVPKFGHEICFCNGVICFSSRYRATHQLHLFNPSLRKLKILPPSCIVDVRNRYTSVFGFGVDNVSGDYKVVRIFYDSFNWEAWPMVEVYSLRSDSWKRVELNFNVPRVHYLHFSSVFFNGAVHWFADAHFNKPRVILSFDLCDEVFHEIELPVGLFVFKRGYVFLFKESVSIFIETANENPNEGLRYEVWIMKEYGVVESWTKEFTGLVEGVRTSEVGFSKSGKVILRKNDGMLAVLNLECGQLEDIDFHEKLYRVADYVESLVLLEDGVSSRAQPEVVTHQGDGGPSSSAVEAEDDDAKWRAAISSLHVSSPSNEIQSRIWRDWRTSS